MSGDKATEEWAVKLLREQANISARELAKRTKVPKSEWNRLLYSLEKDGKVVVDRSRQPPLWSIKVERSAVDDLDNLSQKYQRMECSSPAPDPQELSPQAIGSSECDAAHGRGPLPDQKEKKQNMDDLFRGLVLRRNERMPLEEGPSLAWYGSCKETDPQWSWNSCRKSILENVGQFVSGFCNAHALRPEETPVVGRIYFGVHASGRIHGISSPCSELSNMEKEIDSNWERMSKDLFPFTVTSRIQFEIVTLSEESSDPVGQGYYLVYFEIDASEMDHPVSYTNSYYLRDAKNTSAVCDEETITILTDRSSRGFSVSEHRKTRDSNSIEFLMKEETGKRQEWVGLAVVGHIPLVQKYLVQKIQNGCYP